MTHAPGDDRRYIVEKTGAIQLLHTDGTMTQFVDINADNKVNSSANERGLLGLAFHPDYVSNGRFWVHYSAGGGTGLPSGDTVIQEFRRDPNDPDLGDPTPVAPPTFTATQPHSNHNGGSIEFSPIDGLLYLGLGDGGSADDPDDHGQTKSTVLGSILRLDVSATDGSYAIPSGNISDGAPEIWDWGLRNPWRFSFDSCDGDLYIGDVGQNQWEEIDVAPAGEGNHDWGWNCLEGTHDFQNQPPCNAAGASPPVAEYNHGDGCSVSGGYVYRGSAIPWLRGAYLYGDYCSSRVWSFRWNAGVVSDEQELTDELEEVISLPSQGITSFGQDNQGEIYILVDQGRVYRIDPE